MSARTIVKALPVLFAFAFLAIGFLFVSANLSGASGKGSSPGGGGASSPTGRGGTGMTGMTGMGGSAMGTAASTSNGPRAAVLLSYSVTGSEDGNVGPDGKKHDTFTAMTTRTIRAGQPVTISIKNTDEMAHSMNAPELGLNIMVPAARDGEPGTVDFTFTPSRPGTYRWYCAIPCDGDSHGWAMTSGSGGPGQDGFMAGTITVE